MAKYWTFRNEAGANGKKVVLQLYGPISNAKVGAEDTSPASIADELQAQGDISEITVRINSLGGSLWAGHAICNILRSHPAPVTVRVDGVAASAAAIIAMSGNTIIMPSNSMLFLHNPQGEMFGYASDMRKVAEDLDTIKISIVNIFTARTKQTAAKISGLMNDETWLTADTAKQLGFADIVTEEAVSASATAADSVLVINGLTFNLQTLGISMPPAARAALLRQKSGAQDPSGLIRNRADNRMKVSADFWPYKRK